MLDRGIRRNKVTSGITTYCTTDNGPNITEGSGDDRVARLDNYCNTDA